MIRHGFDLTATSILLKINLWSNDEKIQKKYYLIMYEQDEVGDLCEKGPDIMEGLEQSLLRYKDRRWKPNTVRPRNKEYISVLDAQTNLSKSSYFYFK